MHQAARPVLSNTDMQAWCFEPVISELRSWRQDQSSRASAATIVCLLKKQKQKHDYLFCVQCLSPSGFWENQCPRFVEKLSPLYPLNDKTFFCSLHFSTALTTNYKPQDTVSLRSQGFLLFEAFVETDTKKAFAIWNSVRWGKLYLRTERKTQGCLVGITGGFSQWRCHSIKMFVIFSKFMARLTTL